MTLEDLGDLRKKRREEKKRFRISLPPPFVFSLMLCQGYFLACEGERERERERRETVILATWGERGENGKGDGDQRF